MYSRCLRVWNLRYSVWNFMMLVVLGIAVVAFCGSRSCLFLRPQKREQNHVANGLRVRQQHHQTIDAHAYASGGRHAVRESADVVFVHLMGFFVSALTFFELLLEAAALVFGIVEFAEAV